MTWRDPVRRPGDPSGVKQMRGLFISNVVPWPLAAGDKIRAYHLVRAAAKVMDLTLVCFAYDEGEQRDLDAVAPLVRESFMVPRETCRYRTAAQLPRARRILAGLRGYLHPTRPVLFAAWESKAAQQLVQRLARCPSSGGVLSRRVGARTPGHASWWLDAIRSMSCGPAMTGVRSR